MKKLFFGSVMAILVSTSNPRAEENCAPLCGPTVALPNVKLYRQLPPDASRCAPTTTLPGPTFYRADVKPPRCLDPVPLPPVTFFCGKVTNVTFHKGKAPPVLFYKAEVKPPECLPPVKMAGLTFFRQDVRAPECAPPVSLPNVSFFKGVAQPGCSAPACTVPPTTSHASGQ